jgi:hypothetical protein
MKRLLLVAMIVGLGLCFMVGCGKKAADEKAPEHPEGEEKAAPEGGDAEKAPVDEKDAPDAEKAP